MTNETKYCYLCGMGAPPEGDVLCEDCIEHMPKGTEVSDWLDPTMISAALLLSTDDPGEQSDLQKSIDKANGVTTPAKPAGSTTYNGTYNSGYWDPSTNSYVSGSGGGGLKVACTHHGTRPVFAIGKRQFAAANSGGIDYGEKGSAAVLDCAGVASRNSALFVESTAKYADLNEMGSHDYVRLHWPDMGTPPKGTGRRFWRNLVSRLPQGRTVACCIGGHGRTGTCLAAILVANDRMCADKAIDFIRENHCDRAIETQSQENYIRSLQTDKQRKDNDSYLERFETAEVVEPEEQEGAKCVGCGNFQGECNCMLDCLVCGETKCSCIEGKITLADLNYGPHDETFPGVTLGSVEKKVPSGIETRPLLQCPTCAVWDFVSDDQGECDECGDQWSGVDPVPGEGVDR